MIATTLEWQEIAQWLLPVFLPSRWLLVALRGVYHGQPFPTRPQRRSSMFDVTAVRQQFPALHRQRDGVTPIFFDGPAGTQVPQRVIDAIVHYLTRCNANHGGLFATSRESDAVLDQAFSAVADLLNAASS